jgi:hypothetical protein
MSVLSDWIVPVVVLPPDSPFTSQVTVVGVTDVLEVFERVSVAVNSTQLLIGSETVTGVIETAVTRIVPLLPPQADSVRSTAMAITATAKSRAFRSINDLPSPAYEACESSVHTSSLEYTGIRSKDAHVLLRVPLQKVPAWSCHARLAISRCNSTFSGLHARTPSASWLARWTSDHAD